MKNFKEIYKEKRMKLMGKATFEPQKFVEAANEAFNEWNSQTVTDEDVVAASHESIKNLNGKNERAWSDIYFRKGAKWRSQFPTHKPIDWEKLEKEYKKNHFPFTKEEMRLFIWLEEKLNQNNNR